MRKLALVALVLVSSSSAFAQYLGADEIVKGLRFGAEMTLSSDELLKSYPNGDAGYLESDLSIKIIKGMRKNLKKKYLLRRKAPKISTTEFHSHYDRTALKIKYPNGFQMSIFSDPGALEMNTSPSTYKDIKDSLNLIQEDYFDTGKQFGLEPALFTGSGHIHIEVTKLHPVAVRNFLADYYNATGLAAGGLNEDVFNQIGVGEIPEANKKILRDLFHQFDKNPSLEIKDFEQIKTRAYDIPYKKDSAEYRKVRSRQRPEKYFAVSFDSLLTLGTIEIRAIRPQASAASYLKLLKLFSLRMKLAEEKRVRGERVPIGDLKSVRGNPQEVIAQFDKYLSEVGLDIEDYREFVMPWWQNKGGEFDKYIRARSVRSCSALFI